MQTNIVVDILPPIPYVPKFWFSSHGPKCCQPINLQDSLKCNISKTKWIMKYIFVMQINIKVFCKLILSFWVCAIRHAQITQNKNIFAISPEKHGGMKLIFCLHMNKKVFYKLIVSLWACISRKTWRMNLIFCLQINTKGFFKLLLSF